MLYLPRLTVLVTIVADRPGAWFPGPLGPYLTLLPAICLSRDFKRAKVPSSFVLASFGGSYSKKTFFASRQPNHVKHLLSGLYDLQKYNFISLRSPPATPGSRTAVIFRSEFCPLISFFFPLTGISARGPQGRSGTALRPVSHFSPHMQLGFLPSSLFRKGRARTNCLLCAPP